LKAKKIYCKFETVTPAEQHSDAVLGRGKEVKWRIVYEDEPNIYPLWAVAIHQELSLRNGHHE